jgi:hypothetical protein
MIHWKGNAKNWLGPNCKPFSQHLPGGTDKKTKKHQSGSPIFRLRFEPGKPCYKAEVLTT